MSQKCKVRINLNEIPSKKVSSIKKALEPDNINFQNEGDMKKLISTIDEVLEHTNIALEVIE